MKRKITLFTLVSIAAALLAQQSLGQQSFVLEGPVLEAPVRSNVELLSEQIPTPADPIARSTFDVSPPAPVPTPAAPIAPPVAPNEIPQNDDAIEYLTRGPVHEAFVTQIPTNATASPILQTAPPEAINEVPPEYQPEGENVVWIPGYWAWDEDRSDYLWVSGVWRVSPENRRWVPGYWTTVTDERDAAIGYQWVSGFWADAQIESVEYLSPPPATLEQGPSTPAISQDHFWVPGNWTQNEYRYSWRPGYWHVHQPERIWVPCHYVWTPNGCVYVNGYWDYRLPDRGQLFTPVYVQRHVVSRPSFAYRPRFVVNTPGLLMHLFVNPRQHHYYFGDYYEPHCRKNYHSYADYHRRGYGYDPLYVYYSNHFRRQGINYASRLSSWNLHFSINLNKRPSRTIRSHYAHPTRSRNQYGRDHRGSRGHDAFVVARSLQDEVRARINTDRRLVRAADSRRRAAQATASQLTRISQDRSRIERHTGHTQGNRKGPGGPKANDRYRDLARTDRSHTTTRAEVPSLRLPKPSTMEKVAISKDHSHSHLYDERSPRPRYERDTTRKPLPARTLASQSKSSKSQNPRTRPERDDVEKLVIRGTNEQSRNSHTDRLERIRTELRRNFSPNSDATKKAFQVDLPKSKARTTTPNVTNPRASRAIQQASRTPRPLVETPTRSRTNQKRERTAVPRPEVTKQLPRTTPSRRIETPKPTTRPTPPKVTTQRSTSKPTRTPQTSSRAPRFSDALTREAVRNTTPRPQPTSRTRPTPTPRTIPKAAPRTKPAPAPRVRATPTPRTRTAPAPKTRPTPAPRTRPTPQPRTRSTSSTQGWGGKPVTRNQAAAARRAPTPRPTPKVSRPARPKATPRAPSPSRQRVTNPRSARSVKSTPRPSRPTPPKRSPSSSSRKKKGK